MTPPPPEVAGVPASPDDVEAIVALVAEVQRAQQEAQPDAFLAPLRPDSIWTTAHGKRLTGYDELSAFTRAVLPRTLESPITATYAAEYILFIRPDVAAVKVRQRPISRDGERLDADLATADDLAVTAAEKPDVVPGAPLYVLAKDGDDGRWRIAAAQNTKVIDPDTIAAWVADDG